MDDTSNPFYFELVINKCNAIYTIALHLPYCVIVYKNERHLN